MPVSTSFHILATKARGEDPFADKTQSTRLRLRQLLNFLGGTLGGQAKSPVVQLFGETFAQANVALSSASGDITTTINGVGIVVAQDTDDTVTAGLIAAAINASSNALVSRLVRASHLAGTIAVDTVLPGQWVSICGVRLTAMKSAGSLTQLNQFNCITSNNATATSLAAVINAHPILKELVFASASGATVTVRARFPASDMPNILLDKSASTFTLSAAALAAGATVLISSQLKGTAGNQTTLAASGTGATASAARLTGGTQTVVTL